MNMHYRAEDVLTAGDGPRTAFSLPRAQMTPSDIAAIFWRGRRIVAICVAAAALAGLLFILLTPPLYRASAQLFIDPRAKRIMSNEVAPSGLGSSANGADASLVDSQIEIIRSDAVMRRAMRQLGLAGDPEFASGATGPGLRVQLHEAIAGLLGGGRPRDAVAGPEEGALEKLRRALVLRRVGNTYIVDVDAFSTDPAKAARIANTISQTYLADQSQSSADSTRETTTSLSAKLDELRGRVRTAEDAVERYRATTDLVGTQGGLVTEQQLQDINNRLVLARARTAELKARLDEIARLAKSGAAAAGFSEALQSGVITNLRGSLAEINRREGDNGAQFGPQHPATRALRQEREKVERLLQEELGRILQSARTDLDVARANEASLARSFADGKKTSLDSSQAQVRMRELQREAEASRAVYEAYLVRAKQSSEEESLSNNNARIITPATPPARPSYPATGTSLGAALAVGLGLGLLLTWLKHLRGGWPEPSRRVRA